MPKALIFAVFLLVVSACSTIGQDSQPAPETPSVAAAEAEVIPADAGDPTASPDITTAAEASPATTLTPEAPAAEDAAPAREADQLTNEPVLAYPLNSPDSYNAVLVSASVVSGTATVVGNTINVSNSASSPVTVNVTIAYDAPNGYGNKYCDSPNHTVMCQWVEHADDPSNHSVPESGLGSGFTPQPGDVAELSFDVVFIIDDGEHYVTYGYNEIPTPDFAQKTLTILLHRLSG